MTILTMIEGRLKLPDDAVKHLKLESTDNVSLELMPDGRLALSAPNHETSDLSGFIGSLHDPDRPALSLDEITRITEDSWAGKR